MKLTHTSVVSLLAAAFAVTALAATTSTAAAQTAAYISPTGPKVVLDTTMGRITCQLYDKQAPVAVANFIALAEGTKDWTDPTTGQVQHNKRYYDGTIFHRVIPGFMIQGGDPSGKGTGNPGYKFNDELDPKLNFDRPGRLAMANRGANTNGSQFFITEEAYDSLNQHYTLFGQCDDSSVKVVKKIANVSRNANDKPITPVVINKVTVVRKGEKMPPLPEGSAKH
jgi:peptidyl-prolyl cis-trans isomerase A (cyclophilin A)